jgi:hypothetical protein
MSIKIFTLDKNNKISFTKDELEKLLNEAYWEGYYNNKTTTISYPSNPYYTWSSNGTLNVGNSFSITNDTITSTTPILKTNKINGEFNNVSSN